MGSDDVKPFHVLLAERLARRKMTVAELAPEIGRSESQVYRYLEGKSRPRTATIRRIAAVLKISPAQLAQSLLVEAAEADADVLTRPSVGALLERIALLEEELNQRRIEDDEPPLDPGD